MEQTAEPPAKPPSATQPGVLFPYSKDVLAAMISTDGADWLQTTHLLTPPFAIRAKVRLADLDDLRLHYALGAVVFNWADSPREMRVHDPRNSSLTPVPDKGILLPNVSHELVWEITTNEMTVTADGQVRFQAKGDYQAIKGRVGIGQHPGPANFESLILETPRPLEDPPMPIRDHGPIPGDILSTMVPEANVRAANEPDGLTLRWAGGPANRLMSTQTFKPPFIIRTRAKTDAFNIRLYCGAGQIIFNWEMNAQELRVHDPLSGQQIGVPGKGVISPNEWHAITWEIQNYGMRVIVDGQLRFQNRKDYHTLDGAVGIAAVFSKVTVDYFLVEKK
jgi:hypothetical protein